MRTAKAWAIVLMVSAVACGGKVISDGAISSNSTSGPDGSDSGPPTTAGDPAAPNAPTPGDTDAGQPFITCNGSPASGVNPGGLGCQVSFTNDLLGRKMGAAGAWGCAASGCHDPQGGIPPKIDVLDALYTYRNLYQSGTGTKPYINPCSTSESDSEIIGNLSFPSTAGEHMPLGNTRVPSSEELELVRSWVQCGAPLN